MTGFLDVGLEGMVLFWTTKKIDLTPPMDFFSWVIGVYAENISAVIATVTLGMIKYNWATGGGGGVLILKLAISVKHFIIFLSVSKKKNK